MQQKLSPQHFTALRSAVDLLTGCVSPDYIRQHLADYRVGGSRHTIAASLYSLIDAIEAHAPLDSHTPPQQPSKNLLV